MASWATATSSASCCPRRSRPWSLGGASSLCRLDPATHSIALIANGSVWSWGFGGLGQLGHCDQQIQLLPKKIEAFAGRCVAAVSAGVFHSLALTADGAAWSWGQGGTGCLGHGEHLSKQLLPKKIPASYR